MQCQQQYHKPSLYIYIYQKIFTKRSLTGRGTSTHQSQHHLSKKQRTTFSISIFA